MGKRCWEGKMGYKCEICEKNDGEFRHILEGEYYCKSCLKKEFKKMTFEDYLNELFAEVEKYE